MKSYFENCMNAEEALKTWRTLAREIHPDMHQENKERWTEEFKELNRQYASFASNYARAEGFKRQQEAHAEGKKSAADYHDLNNVAEELRQRIQWALNNLPGVDVELIGFWVWLTGNTYEHRDTIGKAGLGFTYSRSKKAWYFAGVPSFNKHHMKLDEIRGLHGSTKFSKQEDKQEQRAGIPAYAAA